MGFVFLMLNFQYLSLHSRGKNFDDSNQQVLENDHLDDAFKFTINKIEVKLQLKF